MQPPQHSQTGLTIDCNRVECLHEERASTGQLRTLRTTIPKNESMEKVLQSQLQVVILERQTPSAECRQQQISRNELTTQYDLVE